MERLVSLLGIAVLLGLARLLRVERGRVLARTVIGGLGLQFGLALLVLRTTPGRVVFRSLGEAVERLLDFVDAGSRFVFGDLVDRAPIAFEVLPTIIVFAALTSVLYHVGLLQLVVRALAWGMHRILGTSGAESLAAAANVFIGMTEAPLLVRPYLAAMTSSELLSLMVGGLATVAGGVLAAYIAMGIDAAHLIAASVISAPAALLVAKVMLPETERPRTAGRVETTVARDTRNVIDALSRGASEGVRLAINVGAMLIAFIAAIELLDAAVAWVLGSGWSLDLLLGYGFAPIAWCLGVPWEDCLDVGRLLGIKTVANEFIAYERLSSWQAEGGGRLGERSVLIATYALCGFANFGSIGIQLGGLVPLIPERRSEVASLALRAMAGGLIAGFLTACVAGVVA